MKKLKKVLNFSVIFLAVLLCAGIRKPLADRQEKYICLRIPLAGDYGRMDRYMNDENTSKGGKRSKHLLSPAFLGVVLPEDSVVRIAPLNDEQVLYEIAVNREVAKEKIQRITEAVENAGGIVESFVYTQDDIDEFEKLLEMEATYFGKTNPFLELKNELTGEEYMDFYAELYFKLSGAAERSISSLLAISVAPETDAAKKRALMDIKNAQAAFHGYLRKDFIEDIEAFLRDKIPEKFEALKESGNYLHILKAIANSMGNSIFSESYAISTSGYETIAILEEDSENYAVFERDINKLQKVLENFSRNAFNLPSERPHTHIMIIMPNIDNYNTGDIMEAIGSSRDSGVNL